MVLNDTISLGGLKQDLYFIGKFNSGTFNQNDLNRIINKYYKQAQTAIRDINEDFYVVATRADLLSGTNMQYSYPTDYEKIKTIFAATTPTNLASPLRSEFVPCAVATTDQMTNPAYSLQKPTVVFYGDYFEIPNTITNTVITGLRLIYVPLLSELTLDTDTPNIFKDYHDVITWGSLIDIAPRLNNDELLVRASQMFKKRMEEMKESASNRLPQQFSEYVEGQSPEGNWQYPFGKPLTP